MLNRFCTVLVLAALTALALNALAQGYPNKPLSLIVPFPPGASTDIASRAIALELAKLLGQPVVVENRGGAGGNIGGEAAARSAPDGYTLFMTTNNIHSMNPLLYSKMSYDPNKDFAPVAPLLLTSLVLVQHPSMKANSVQELMALAKASPGKMTMGSAGSGTINHLTGEMFKLLAGVDLLHIPYKGGAPALTDLIGGQVNMMFSSVPLAMPHIKSGKLRALATTGAKRAEALPDLTTIAEAGLPGFEATVWFGVLVPKGTPRDIIQRLNAALIKAANAPAFRERTFAAGFEVIPGSPERLAEMIKADVARWAPVVKASGAKID
ncbi:MAG: ABC transporter substrate-binding protein [Betaproteobacteria bacterium RIFCSPLOWO2_12_FULL_65_14]|nr:MAG: ABC transporter substrate-binding protein [Betaproteobacteria bacterium RIFCSPLOWO2_12_FULL_65_14]